ncbi:VWA domain-containing protein [Paraflavisolibacter sp. H34]|uniref:VWA domain-containing protein n=1 Tax=Huijunlia imazamoxiresistens TaxID=3127457 RepID=UPI003019CC5D
MMLYDWFKDIEFARKWVLPFLGMLPVFAWLQVRMAASLKAGFMVTTARAFTVKTFRNLLAPLPLVLRLLSLGCLLLALARPQVRNAQKQIRGEGMDIVLAMDVSGSMLSSDFYPNRLEVAKQVAADFVRSRPVDPIGLVIFSGESYSLVPLSSDHQVLLEQIQGLRSGMLQDGTLIGEGLATAVERLSAGRSKSKVVILLTDGKEQPPENRLIDPLTALEIARAKGVKVYTIGMNAIPSATVGERGLQGSGGGLDEELMKRIAIGTGGEYFRARDKEGLRDIYRYIDRLEKSRVEVITKERVAEKFAPFLLAALVLLALEILFRYILLRTFP